MAARGDRRQRAPTKPQAGGQRGIKAGLFARRVQSNVSVFYDDYSDKQLTVLFADPIYPALARLANVPDTNARF